MDTKNNDVSKVAKAGFFDWLLLIIGVIGSAGSLVELISFQDIGYNLLFMVLFTWLTVVKMKKIQKIGTRKMIISSRIWVSIIALLIIVPAVVSIVLAIKNH